MPETERFKTSALYPDVKSDVLELLKTCARLRSDITIAFNNHEPPRMLGQFYSSVEELYSAVGVKVKFLPLNYQNDFDFLKQFEQYVENPFANVIKNDRELIEKIKLYSKAYLTLRKLVEFLGYTQVEHEIIRFEPEIINMQVILDRYRMIG